MVIAVIFPLHIYNGPSQSMTEIRLFGFVPHIHLTH